ncbi:MAG: c-type cytochrome [Verrucomicrobiales bacterium]|nr:cytochrome c [Verrucomicrobiota bacterium JB025]
MDSQSDNPILRFSAIVWGLGIFLIFAVILGVFWWVNRDTPETLEENAAKVRYETKAKAFEAQAASLPQELIDAAIPAVAEQLASVKPAAVEKPEQVIPGSPTAEKLAAAPAADTAAVDAMAGDPDEPIDPAVMEKGKISFILCSACHGQNGEGGPIAPPLAGSEWVNGPASNLIRIQLRGLVGPINVAGKEYDFIGGMAAQAQQSDEDIAAVLTYVRNSFGNKAPAVKPEQVAALRSEVGKPQLTADDLVKP